MSQEEIQVKAAASEEEEEEKEEEEASPSNRVLTLVELLGTQLITQDRGLLHHYAEQIAAKPCIKQSYIDLVLTTRQKMDDEVLDEQLVVAASNAASVLNYGGLSRLFEFRFGEVRDWNGIRIPHANLNYAQILGCNFNDSDLSCCTLFQAVLRGSSFRRCNLNGAWTGEAAPLRGHTQPVGSVAVNHNSTVLASGSMDRTIRLWQLDSGECIGVLEGHTGAVSSLSLGVKSTNLLASGSLDGTVRVWDLDSKTCQACLYGSSKVRAVRFAPDGRTLAVGCDDTTISVWDVETRVCIATMAGSSSSVNCLEFVSSGLLACNSRRNVHLWDVETRQCVGRLEGHQWPVSSLAASPDEKRIAAGSEDGLIRVWDVETRRCVLTLDGHKGKVTGITFTSDGTLLASSSEDQMVKVWDVGGTLTHTESSLQSCIVTLRGHTDAVLGVCCWGPLWLASCGKNMTIRLWKVEPGKWKTSAHLPCHSSSRASTVCFSQTLCYGF